MNLRSGREYAAPGEGGHAEKGAVEAVHPSGVGARLASAVHVCLFAIWVAVCAVAPEFIWQGFLRELHHFDWITVGSALLVGAIVAFFVEPLTERLRAMSLRLAHRHKTTTHATLAAFGFAILAVFAHEAITAYASGNGAENQEMKNFVYAISEVIQWVWIPFVVTVAWLCARLPRWVSFPVLLLAFVAIVLVGFVFDWYAIDILTTSIPCACVLFGGFHVMRKHSGRGALSRCTVLTAVMALIWLASMGLVQLVLSLLAVKTLHIYTMVEYAIDFRFYLGWVIGLAVAPRPTRHHAVRSH